MSKKWGENQFLNFFLYFQKAQKTEHWRGRKGQNQCKSHKSIEMWATCQSFLELFIDLLTKFSIYCGITGPTELCSAVLTLSWCKLLFGLRLQAIDDLLCLEQAIITPPGIRELYFMFGEYSWKVWSFLKSYWERMDIWKKGGRVRNRKELKEKKTWSGYNVWE